jgi:hypothetical protein
VSVHRRLRLLTFRTRTGAAAKAARPDTRTPGSLIQRAYAHATGFDHAGPEGARGDAPARSPSALSTASASRTGANPSRAGLSREGSSEASVGAHRPSIGPRKAGSLLLHRGGLSPPGPCRSPGASDHSCNGTIVAGHSPQIGVAKPLAKGVQLRKSTIYYCDSAGIAFAAYSYFSAQCEAQLFFQRAGVRVARRIGFGEGP